MTDTIVTALVGGLAILMIGWLKLDINRLADKLDHLAERVDALGERVARIEGRLDEREHQS